MSDCNIETVHGLDFTQEEIDTCLQKGGLLSLELEFTKGCNMACTYCYSSAGKKKDHELTPLEIKSVVDQAADLGAKKIILLGGGEPLLYEKLPEIVEYIYDKGLEQTMFTNGMTLTEALARFLLQHQVSIVIKHNSDIPEVQDELSGVKFAFRRIKKGFEALLSAGYPSPECQLGIETIICKQNLEEIPGLWIWARENGIIPYFEILTLQGRAKEHPELEISMAETKEVFEKLKEIDEKQFGNVWDSYPTIAGSTCKRNLYSCLVNSQGDVNPCTGIDIAVGNVRERSLKEILHTSTAINDMRNIYTRIKGICRECEYNAECYGCRGNAYQVTGDYLASDPTCWLHNEKVNGSGSTQEEKQLISIT